LFGAKPLQQAKDPQEFGHIKEDTDGVVESNKFEETDKKHSSTSATLSSPSRTRDKSEEPLWK
jgi:hypothetical protein